MTRVAVLILHAPARSGDGPLTRLFEAIRRANAEHHVVGFRDAGADDVRIDDAPLDERGFSGRIRDLAGSAGPSGIVVLGSGSSPLATAADRRAFVRAAAGSTGRALSNNRYSSDILAIPDAAVLDRLLDIGGDNGLPRWLGTATGLAVDDLRGRWRLQMDLDSPLDALLVRPAIATRFDAADVPTAAVRAALASTLAVTRDPGRELIVAGRASASGLAWLERATASRTRALIEERGFRTRAAGQRPVASSLGLLLERDGPEALGAILALLGDAALVDSRVLLAHRFGASERGWPAAEDRFASDLLLVDRIADPWLRTLTAAARDAPIPIVLGGHSLVGPGLRLALGPERSWT